MENPMKMISVENSNEEDFNEKSIDSLKDNFFLVIFKLLTQF